MADSDEGSNDGFLLGDLLFQNARPEDLRIDRIQMDDLFTVNQSISTLSLFKKHMTNDVLFIYIYTALNF